MRSFSTCCIVALVVITVGADGDVLKEEDIKVLQDEKLFREVYACVMDEAPCPDRLKELKEFVPGYIRTNCANCSPKEKMLYEKHIKIVSEMYPEQFKNLLEKYGPKRQ